MSNTRHTMFFMNKEYPNFGGGSGSGGGGSYSVTTLYENQTTSEVSTITLDDDYSNYDVLYFDILRSADGGYYHDTQYIETSVLSVNDRIEILLYSGIYSGWTLASATSLTRLVYSGSLYIKRILGIKYAGGGSSGGGADVEANPSGEATDTLESLRVGNTIYSVGESGSGIVLFDGTWKNQDILEITPYLATITDGELVCSGLHCGIVVSDVTGLTSKYNPYQLIIEGYSASGFGMQAGRCNPTSDLNGIIQYGTNRITYTNDSIPLGSFILHLIAASSSQGVFVGGAYTVSSTNYVITKIYLAQPSSERTYN